MTTRRAARHVAILLSAFLLPACAAAKAESPAPTAKTPSPAVPQQAPIPAWVQLSPYDSAQLALLNTPVDAPIHVRAPRTYPDLSRFTFTGETPIRTADPGMWADLVAEVVEESPYLYVFRDGPESLANVTALFGPGAEPEPDPWKRAVTRADGSPELAPAMPEDASREHLDKAAGLGPREALEPLKKAAELSPQCPGVLAMVGDAALGCGDLVAAEDAANKALALDPLYPQGHRILAEVLLRRSDRARARASIARALALYPASKRGWQVAEAIAGREISRAVTVPQPFIEVSPAGAVVVVSCNRPMCERYAACKAAMRYEPQFRKAVLGQKTEAPYHLSATEELVCLQAGIGAHLRARSQPGPPEPDPTAELLWRLAKEKGLTAYAMFEIVGRHRPEWLRLAPKALHDAIADYVLDKVLASPSPASPAIPGTAVITASLGRAAAPRAAP